MRVLHTPELLSPAGGKEAFVAAVQNGANAVYFGTKSFGARAGAENFTFDEMKEAVRYASVRGVKTYLTLNTLATTAELDSFAAEVKNAAKCGVSGLIIQDFGGARIAKEVAPGLPLHASTQMSAHNERDVAELLKLGFSRVVLARELTRKEIEKIYKNTGAELEVFVHGALCVCVSGQCLMSSFIGGRSGNRGRCAQPCRRLYEAEGKRGYFLSPKDLCLLDEISSLTEAGVKSFKIEGRMKSPEYVASVTAMYRKYIDNPKIARKEDVDELKKIFVRGNSFTKGYYDGKNTPEIMNYSVSNDNISQNADRDALKKAALTYKDGAENIKIPLKAKLFLKRGEGARLILSDGENTSEASGAVPEEAVNLPLTFEAARARTEKTGGTPYEIASFDAEIDENLTLRAAEINSLRREAIEKLTEMRGAVPEMPLFDFDYDKKYRKRGKPYVAASVLTKEQLYAAEGADVIYLPLGLIEEVGVSDSFAAALPKVTYDVEKYIARLKAAGVKRALASTVGTAKALIDADIECIGDFGLNVTNYVSASEYERLGIKTVTLSPECSPREIISITESSSVRCEVVTYGKMMVMTSRACLIRGIRGRCDCEKPIYLKDRLGAEFLLCADKTEHTNVIYNSLPTFAADKPHMLSSLNADGMRLVFTDETAEETKRIIKMYKGEIPPEPPEKFTRGYFVGAKKRK